MIYDIDLYVFFGNSNVVLVKLLFLNLVTKLAEIINAISILYQISYLRRQAIN